MRRPLAETLLDLSESVGVFTPSLGPRVTHIEFDIPIEVELAGTSRTPLLLADVPGWRWTTDFDVPRSRISFAFGWGEAS